MSRRWLADIDLLGFSILNAYLHPVSSDPSGLGTGDKGRVWFNTTSNKLMVWNGTAAIDFLARANHTGTQLSSTISDLATTVKAYRLDEFAAPTASVNFNSQKGINQLDPTNPQDSATKNYVDTQLSGLTSGQVLKGAVKVATTTNITLTAPGATLDGISMSNGDLFLATGQTTASANGPYVYNGSASTATRATNWDSSGEAVLGSYWIVQQGTNADTFALLTNDSAITLGTTALTFVFRGASGSTYSVNGGLTLAGSVISVNPGTGILAPAGSSTTTSVDFSVVGRKIAGNIPASTSGIYTVSGANVTVNHALGNASPLVQVTVGSTPPSGMTTGQPVFTDYSVSDTNNVVITLPAAPAANNYLVTILG